MLDAAWDDLNKSEDLKYINARLESFNHAVLDKFGKRNYFQKFLEYTGVGPQSTLPIDALMQEGSDTWENSVQKLTATPE